MQDAFLMNRIDHLLELMRMFSAYTGPGECHFPLVVLAIYQTRRDHFAYRPKTSQTRMNPSLPNRNFLFFRKERMIFYDAIGL